MSTMDQARLFSRSNYFAEFEERTRERLLSIIKAKVPEQDTRDVYQDALLNIWRAFNKITGDGDTIRSPGNLASRIVQRQVANYWRMRGRRPDTRQLTVDPEDPDPHREIIEQEEMKLIKLTASEKTILWLIGLGSSNDIMAEKLHITINTLRTHIKNVHKKTGIKDRVNLALFASKYLKSEEVTHEKNP